MPPLTITIPEAKVTILTRIHGKFKLRKIAEIDRQLAQVQDAPNIAFLNAEKAKIQTQKLPRFIGMLIKESALIVEMQRVQFEQDQASRDGMKSATDGVESENGGL